ncbi:MAG: 5'/3'-nucleotidase SurE [Acidimicrobiia bacterium]
MRILLTNDDGIDSVGLHILARAMQPFGEVVVIAPDSEYSGASAAIGALHLMRPELHRVQLDGLGEAWTVSGPPALCVMFARMGAFGPPFDLVVSGINPGANVGRSVYHSGTVGAALTARSGGITGIAVSQDVSVGSIEGQAWDEMLSNQLWDTAAAVAAQVVESVVATPLLEPAVLNINVPNLPVDQIRGWKRTTLATMPIRSMKLLELEPKIGHEDAYHVKLSWGEAMPLPLETDGGAVSAGYVSLTWLSRIHELDPHVDDISIAETPLDVMLHP